MTHATRCSTSPYLLTFWRIYVFMNGGGGPTSRRRWSRLVLLRVPMMRRPIFLAYHTELSMLLVAAAVVAVVKVACRLLCASSGSCSRLRAGGGGAGWRADGGRGASIHLVSPLLPPLPHRYRQGAAEELMEELFPGGGGAETHRGRPPPVSSRGGGGGRHSVINGGRQTPDLTGKRERGASGGGLTCRGERASLSRWRESSGSQPPSVEQTATDSNRLQG